MSLVGAMSGPGLNYLIGWVYLGAFSSLYFQFPGLYGFNGILPIHDFLNKILQQISDELTFQNLLQLPSLIRYAGDLQVSVDALCEFLLIVGMVLSVVICLGGHRPILFFLLWSIYLSFYIMGQTFMSFQWDILLLETGFLIVLNSIFNSNGSRVKVFNWCFRFVVWKLMFMAGVVKLQSRCPTWEQLTALEVTVLVVYWYMWLMPPCL
jgi:hypothetical protein